MTVSVQASDVQGTALQTQVSSLQTLVTAATNPAVQATLTAALDTAQQQLVMYLMANATARLPAGARPGLGAPNFLTASGLLSAGTINT